MMSKGKGALEYRRMRRDKWKKSSNHWCRYLEGPTTNEKTAEERDKQGLPRKEPQSS